MRSLAKPAAVFATAAIVRTKIAHSDNEVVPLGDLNVQGNVKESVITRFQRSDESRVLFFKWLANPVPDDDEFWTHVAGEDKSFGKYLTGPCGHLFKVMAGSVAKEWTRQSASAQISLKKVFRESGADLIALSQCNAENPEFVIPVFSKLREESARINREEYNRLMEHYDPVMKIKDSSE